MEILTLENDIPIFGIEVADAPDGIGAAFEKLVALVGGGFDRAYYGIVENDKGACKYKAAAEERYDGEAKMYPCHKFVIEKGDYLAATLLDWRKNTDSIHDIFDELSRDARIDGRKPLVEWYKDDYEMICMIRIKG